MKRGLLAFLGAPHGAADVAAVAEQHGLGAVAIEHDHILFAGADLPSRRLSDGSVILGDIFTRTGVSVHATSDGWGNFIAVARQGDMLIVERAALTGMPLYWCRHAGGILCFSHLELVRDLLSDVSIDWEFVGQALAYSNLRTERTGIVGLLELLPGCSLAFDGHGAEVRAIWLPWEHVAKPAASGAAELASALELRIDNSVKAWCSGRSDILLELSGGLDSSIIAASLSAAGADFSAINFATPGADGDERRFARAVAERVGAAMIEARNDDTRIDLLSPPANLHPRPGAYGVLGGLDHAFEEAGGGKAKAVIGGIGGDNVFAFDRSIGPAVDAFEQFGFSRRTLPCFATSRRPATRPSGRRSACSSVLAAPGRAAAGHARQASAIRRRCPRNLLLIPGTTAQLALRGASASMSRPFAGSWISPTVPIAGMIAMSACHCCRSPSSSCA